MPWRETSPMDQRLRFIADLQREYLSLSELIHLWVIMVERPAPLGRTYHRLCAVVTRRGRAGMMRANLPRGESRERLGVSFLGVPWRTAWTATTCS